MNMKRFSAKPQSERRDFLKIGGASLVGLLAQGEAGAEVRPPDTARMAGGVSIQSLNGDWLIACDPKNVGSEENWFNSAAAEGAMHCEVPDILERTFPGYDGVVWYWKNFAATPAGANERLLLKFHAADYLADIWVNGIHAGSHEGGETPFSFDVSPLVKSQKNRLVVRVVNPGIVPVDGLTLKITPHGIKNAPMTVGSFWNPGGIWQPVELLRVPAIRVVDLFADPRLSNGRIEVQVALANDTGTEVGAVLQCEMTLASSGSVVVHSKQDVRLQGTKKIETELIVPEPRPWSPDDPCLYVLTVRIETLNSSHAQSVRCGFRELLFRDGYFRLNGKRMFLKSTHSVAHFPIGQHVPHRPELLRRELIYAKAMGLNCVRWLGRMMFPSELDLCDELGLMVYQESYASWGWNDSPQMKQRFDRAIREMILRDRNHPALVIWGLLNETKDGPIFRHAVEMLPLVRGLDPTRTVLLGSGRWDAQLSIGSIANPRSVEWQHELGEEAAGHPAPDPKDLVSSYNLVGGGYIPGTGDAHKYVPRPWRKQDTEFFRTLGAGSKNVFLSEHGNGSQIDPLRITRLFEQNGARPDLDDAKLYRAILDQFEADWKRWGLDQVFATPSEMILQGEKIHSEQRRVALNAIRSNPKLCGYNLTGICDEGVEGEGLMTTFRELKNGIVDAVIDGFAPLRWCLFVEPVHLYRGASVRIEAVLANEDVLKPGEYPVKLRAVGPAGLAYEKTGMISIADPGQSPEPPFVVPWLKEDVLLNGPAGKYEIAVFFTSGAAALGRQTVILGDAALQTAPRLPVTIWDDSPELSNWFVSRGFTATVFEPTQTPAAREVIFVGRRSSSHGVDDAGAYRALMARVAQGSTAIFLAPGALGTNKNPLGYLPLAKRGELDKDSAGYFWGRDDIVRPHAIFESLPSRCLMDLTFYRDIVAYESFTEMDENAEVVVPCFALGRAGGQGYWSGANLVVYRFGEGKIIASTLRLLENLGAHPAAAQIVLNLATYASVDLAKPLAHLPATFGAQLDAINYPST
jgi:hypothetical protein